MTERTRNEYVFELNSFKKRLRGPTVPGAYVRADLAVDREALAQLLLDAYVGTIDYDGESINEARSEIFGYLDDPDSGPLLDSSWLFFSNGRLAAACLVGWWGSRRCPIISYIFTHPEFKNQGIAAELLDKALASLTAQSFDQVRAVITKGNLPSEKLFRRAGFDRVVDILAAKVSANPSADGLVGALTEVQTANEAVSV